MRFTFGHSLFALAGLAIALAAPRTARAQELSGTYVRYCDVGDTGSLLNGARSVAYGETVGATVCDVFAQGTYNEGYLIAGARGTTAINVYVADDLSTSVVSALATVSGRTINWSSTTATGSIAITQEMSFATTDRSVRLRVTLRNTGATAITNLYYARWSDPDQAFCGASDYSTANDVMRQGPGAGGSLVTATAGGVAVGIGSFDPRARATVPGSVSSTTVATNWSTPTDPGGASSDTYISLTFREPTLAAGASTTFEMFYVFGATSTSAATRFDALAVPACVGEGSACTAGGVTGTCRSSACCTGCWNGAACLAGSDLTGCGIRGGLCATCNDGNACTNDTCSAGTCGATPAGSGTFCDDGNTCTTDDICTTIGTCTGSAVSCDDGLACTSDRCDPTLGCVSSVASGCAIDGMCVASGAPSPFNACLGCVPTVARDNWSPRAVGTACGSPVCEGGSTLPAPTCDASGTCVDGAPTSCSTGRCNAAGDACEGEVPPDMGTPEIDGGTAMLDAGPGTDGGSMGGDAGGIGPLPPGRSGRRGGCAVDAGGDGGIPWARGVRAARTCDAARDEAPQALNTAPNGLDARSLDHGARVVLRRVARRRVARARSAPRRG